jgi:hypothetical protein
MRTSSDRLNVSLSNTGPYLFFNEGGTLGLYNTNTSSFPWFVELDGDSTFQSVNTTTLTSENGTIDNLNSDRISYKNEQLDNDIITSNTYSVSLSTKKLTILAPTNSMTVNLSILMPSYSLNNIFEFRVLTSPSITFQTSAQACIMIDLANDIQRSMTYTTQNHFRFYYTYYNNYYTYILLGAE